MADDLIYCPSCRHKLQLPEELYGQPVECPQCHNRFTAPVPQAAPPAARPAPDNPVADYGSAYADEAHYYHERAAASVRAPAVALLVIAILAIVLNVLGLLCSAIVRSDPAGFETGMRKALDDNPDIDPEDRAKVEQAMTAGHVITFLNLDCGGSLIGNLVTLVGAICMLRLRGYGLARLATILALNPCNFPGCFLELPFGLWGLIVLLNGDVRRAFR